MSNIIVRPFLIGDEVGIVEARTASIMVNAARDYSEAHRQELTMHDNPTKYVESHKKGEESIWVLEDKGRIAGFGSWKSNHILMFYMHPDYTGKEHQGKYTQMLFQAIESDMIAKSNPSFCEIEGTLTAQKFYERMGFQVQRNGTHTMKNGLVIDVVYMNKVYKPEQDITK